ncbi:hypothetical protein L1N85_25765 [Paenibacillus alkaliterrae]|uniref:HTH domain-containing protein n=1 Tax=Paenibacillus alkaliterrae TaxID=320909 RepID=UPI001F30A44C|nr:HTH domain-containing protein [Paenibacillus alkaliterrae]MCF2941740.1 hypothetical protein [Paenibacillus alkaliterrae]
MSKKRFTEDEREKLSKNRYVIKVSDKAITYADEFKQLFIDQYMTGKTPREIFEAHGFDVTVIGMKRVEQSAERWKKEKEGLPAIPSGGDRGKKEPTAYKTVIEQSTTLSVLLF